MLVFVVKRVLWTIPVLLLATFLTFVLVQALPGDPFSSNLQARQNPTVKANLERRYGLDRPWYVQYVKYITNAVRGEFGPSTKSDTEQVLTTEMSGTFPFIHFDGIIAASFPVSALIGGLAFALAAVFGTLVGVVSALRANSWVDYGLTAASTLVFAIPTFVTATYFVFWFTDYAGWDTWPERIGPISILALSVLPYFARLVRASMLETLQSEFLVTARSKGLPRRITIMRHALRNSLIPMVTNAGPLFGFMITGSFIIERIMDVPGLGTDFVAAFDRPLDQNLVLGTTILLCVVIVLVNMFVDILVGALDPRIAHD